MHCVVQVSVAALAAALALARPAGLESGPARMKKSKKDEALSSQDPVQTPAVCVSGLELGFRRMRLWRVRAPVLHRQIKFLY